jgi:hypothetical protein
VGITPAGGGVAPVAPPPAASTGLTPAGQQAVDIQAIQSSANVLQTGIAGAVAGTKGGNVTTPTGATTRTAGSTPARPGTAWTTGQKIGAGVAVVGVLGVAVWWATAGGRRRRR